MNIIRKDPYYPERKNSSMTCSQLSNSTGLYTKSFDRFSVILLYISQVFLSILFLNRGTHEN